jgi:hypothetical protein
MDILNKIDKVLVDQDSGATTTGNVAINTAKGHIDVVGGQCPKGQRYDKNKKVCVPVTDESDMKLSSYKEKAGNFLKTIYKLELPEPIPEFGNTKFSTGTKDQMKRLAKKYGKKYGWNLQEMSIVGGSYISGTTVNIIGSGQTRTWGEKRGSIIDLDRKNKKEVVSADATIENLGRRGLKFNHILGAYVPDQWEQN